MSVFQDKVNGVLSILSDINSAVEELKTCAFERGVFEGILTRVQGGVDRLNLESYSNLEEWTKGLDARIEGVLGRRLIGGLKVCLSLCSECRKFLH